MPPKENKKSDEDKQPNQGNQPPKGTQSSQRNNKRKAETSEPTQLTSRAVRRPRIRRTPEELPAVEPSRVAAGVTRDEHGALEGYNLTHQPRISELPLAHPITQAERGQIAGALRWRQAQSAMERAEKDPEVNFIMTIKGSKPAYQEDIQHLLGGAKHRESGLPPKDHSYLPDAPDPQPLPETEQCANCGRHGHKAHQCIMVTKIGDIAACVICNTKSHHLDDCPEWQKLDKHDRFLVIVKDRAGLPFVRCASEDCFDLARQFEPLAEGYPWSRGFAINFLRESTFKKTWQQYDYSKKLPVLKTDRATRTQYRIRNNPGLVSRFVPGHRRGDPIPPGQPPSAPALGQQHPAPAPSQRPTYYQETPAGATPSLQGNQSSVPNPTSELPRSVRSPMRTRAARPLGNLHNPAPASSFVLRVDRASATHGSTTVAPAPAPATAPAATPRGPFRLQVRAQPDADIGGLSKSPERQ